MPVAGKVLGLSGEATATALLNEYDVPSKLPFFFVFKTGFLCIALAVLELTL